MSTALRIRLRWRAVALAHKAIRTRVAIVILPEAVALDRRLTSKSPLNAKKKKLHLSGAFSF
jgi:hypothetical protein